MAWHDSENYADIRLHTDLYRQYIDNHIGEIFRLDFDQYINRPRDYIEAMNLAAQTELQKKAIEAERVRQQIENGGRDVKK